MVLLHLQALSTHVMEQGLTRDAVAARFEFEGRRLAVVDTAGRMRRSRLDQYDDSGWVPIVAADPNPAANPTSNQPQP